MSWSDSLAFSQADNFLQVGRSADELLVVHQDVVVRVFPHPFVPVGLDEIRVFLELTECRAMASKSGSSPAGSAWLTCFFSLAVVGLGGVGCVLRAGMLSRHYAAGD